MNDQAFETLLAGIAQNKFTVLDLSNKDLTEKQIEDLAIKLKQNKFITHINLSGNPITHLSAGRLVYNLIILDSALVSLNLSNCEMKAISVESIMDAQKDRNKLLIDLSGNPGLVGLKPKTTLKKKPQPMAINLTPKSESKDKVPEKPKKDPMEPEFTSDIKSLTSNLAQLTLEKINVNDLIALIEELIAKYDPQYLDMDLEKDLQKIYAYFYNPMQVQDAARKGGMQKIIEKYNAQLLRVALHVFPPKPVVDPVLKSLLKPILNPMILDEKKAITAAKGMTLLAQRYKIKQVYRALLHGTKFKKAGLGVWDPKKPLKQDNPIVIRSKQNLQNLIKELKKTGEKAAFNGLKKYGLRNDEYNLFELLLNLPYKLQHATNFWYPILNSGRLNSYSEINRTQPGFESAFSTKGNVGKLGNNGFFFCRTYVESVNGDQTRYGETPLTWELNLLRKCGWISMHDQLVPLSSASTTRFFWGKRLVRKTETVNIKNNTQEKTLRDGFVYQYRTSSIQNYTGQKDTIYSFGKSIETTQRQCSFLDEIFYGEDILLGIVLSVIRELRYLEECGFRKHFLGLIETETEENQKKYCGELIKGFFRIEGKYPVSLQLEADEEKNNYEFSAFAGTDPRKLEDRNFTVTNPDGDGRYNSDLSVNEKAMQLATLKEKKKQLEDKLSNTRRYKGKLEKKKKDLEKKLSNMRQQQDKLKENSIKKSVLRKNIENLNAELRTTNTTLQNELGKIAKLDAEKEAINTILNEDTQKRQTLVKYFVEKCDSNQKTLEKMDTSKLETIYENFGELLLEDKPECFSLFLTMTMEKIKLLGNETFIDLIADAWVSLNELAECSVEELAILVDFDIKKPIVENKLSIRKLLNLYEEDPMHFKCLTCDDLTELVFDTAPEVDPVLLKYARENDVDFKSIIEELSEFNATLFRVNLQNAGYGMEDDVEPEEPHSEPEELHSEPEEQYTDERDQSDENNENNEYDDEIRHRKKPFLR